MQIVFRHTLYDASGYGNSARNIAFGMENLGADVKVESLGSNDGILAPADVERIQRMQAKPDQEEQVLVTLNAGITPEEKSRFKKVLSCVMWETSKLPQSMVIGCNQYDGVIVPNEFNRQAFLSAGVTTPMYIAPYGVDLEQYSMNGPSDRFGELEDQFLFLSVFGWSLRKGPDVLIRAYVEEFHEHEPVVLIIKTHGMKINEFNNSWYEDIMNAVGKTSDRPRIRVVTKAMTLQQTAAVYRGADCFVLPTRGEGVGLPILESMASGTPVIATGWGGHTDFLGPRTGYLIPYKLVPASPLHFTDLYNKDQLWADADIGSLRVLMRKLYNKRRESNPKVSEAYEEAKKWNWENTATAFLQAVNDTVNIN